MRIRFGQISQIFQSAQRAAQSKVPKTVEVASSEAGPPTTARASRLTTSMPARVASLAKAQEGASGGKSGSGPGLATGVMKYAMYAAGAGYAYDKTANDFFLSTTSLHDGKGGFTSNERLSKANEEAKANYRRYHGASPEEQKLNSRPLNPIRTVGNKQFVTMTDYRAATKVHVAEMMNTKDARESLLTSLACFTGQRVKAELVEKYGSSHVPADFDLTKSALYEKKNKYALAGVPNEETGASGYASRSATQPFVNKGMKHYEDESEARGLSPRQCMESLEVLLRKDGGLSPEAQFHAGQAILNLRQVYAADEHWGHAEKVVMKALREQGLLLQEETDKLDATLMFEDPSTSVFKRNTSLMGPVLQKIDAGIQGLRLRNDPESLGDFMAMAKEKNMENLPIAHFKLNQRGDGFEDCSGLGDSFTSANAVACINHARLVSGEERLSKQDVGVIAACLNAVYDDASGVRHTLHEIARGCFAGAGYTSEDADHFYAGVCKQAAEEFYGGKNLAANDALSSPTEG